MSPRSLTIKRSAVVGFQAPSPEGNSSALLSFLRIANTEEAWGQLALEAAVPRLFSAEVTGMLQRMDMSPVAAPAPCRGSQKEKDLPWHPDIDPNRHIYVGKHVSKWTIPMQCYAMQRPMVSWRRLKSRLPDRTRQDATF